MTEFYELLEQISYIMAVLGWEDNEGTLELVFNEQNEADERASALGDVFNIVYDNALTEFELNSINAVYNTEERENHKGINLRSNQSINGSSYSEYTNYAELPTFIDTEGLTYTQITNTSAENVDKPIPKYGQMWTIGTALTNNYVFENGTALVNNEVFDDSADFISKSALSDITEYIGNSEITGNVVLNSDTVENKLTSTYKNFVSLYERHNAFNTDMMYSAELYNKIAGNAVNKSACFENAFEQSLLSNQAIQDTSSVSSYYNYNEHNYDEAYSNNTALVGYSLSDIDEHEIDGSQVFTNQSKVLLNTLAGDTVSNRSSVNINVDFKAYADVKNDYDTEQFTKVFVNKLKEELTEYAHGIHF